MYAERLLRGTVKAPQLAGCGGWLLHVRFGSCVRCTPKADIR
jgi:hypothetical protein